MPKVSKQQIRQILHPGQKYNVEVYQDNHLMTVIPIYAKDQEEASTKAREVFFQGITAKVKRAYN